MITEEPQPDDSQALTEALQLGLSTAGIPVPLTEIKGIASVVWRKFTSQGKLESAYQGLSSLQARAQLETMVVEVVKPVAAAMVSQQDALDELQRNLGQHFDQVVELLYRLGREPDSAGPLDTEGPGVVRSFQERIDKMLADHDVPRGLWSIQVAAFESAQTELIFDPLDIPPSVWTVAVAAYSLTRVLDDLALEDLLDDIRWAGPVIEAVEFARTERPMTMGRTSFERQEFYDEEFGKATLNPLTLGAKLRVTERIGKLPDDLTLSRIRSRLRFSRTRPYGVDEMQEWWRIYSLAENLDHELRHLDALFGSSGESSLRCHGVQGAERPEHFTESLAQRGWEVLDTSIKISKFHRIIANLGGAHLYGIGNTEAPVRELIQNASDAIRARRILDDHFPEDAGRIEIRLNREGDGWLLEIDDDGIGMSRKCLSSVLLDFGVSYWGSHLAKVEHPTLQQHGFSAVGKYGIGFFSIFMLGRRVRVTTRELNPSKDTLILDFVNGLEGQAAFRVAEPSARRRGPGTTISIWLDHPPYDKRDGLVNLGTRNLGTGSAVCNLAQMCGAIAPALRVGLAVAEESDVCSVVIKANDWETLSSSDLAQRLYPFASNFVTSKPLPLTNIYNDEGTVVARLALSSQDEFEVTSQGFVVVGGMRGNSLTYLSGLMVGESLTMSRNHSEVNSEQSLFAAWASEQAPLALELPEHRQPAAACVLCALGNMEERLKIVRRGREWLSMIEIREWAARLDHVQIITVSGGFDDQYLKYRLLNDFEPVDGALTMIMESMTPASLYPGGHSWWPLEQGVVSHMILNFILRSCSEAWGAEHDEYRHGHCDPRERFLVGTQNGVSVELPGRYLYFIERVRSNPPPCPAARSACLARAAR